MTTIVDAVDGNAVKDLYYANFILASFLAEKNQNKLN
jgi:hypothetical protein